MTSIIITTKADQVKAWLEGRVPALLEALRRATRVNAVMLTSYVKAHKLTGQVLHVRSGTLRRSINFRIIDDASMIGAAVGSNTEYAGIHEFGGRTRPHEIWPRPPRRFLKFEMNGQTVFRRMVNHPGSVMPERSFLRSALADKMPEIRDEYARAAESVFFSKRGAPRQQ